MLSRLAARPWVVAGAAGAVFCLAACARGSSDSLLVATPTSGPSAPTRELRLVAFSTPQVVFDELIPAFQQASTGRGVRFTTSYGASGDQSRAVAAGQRADLVVFALEPDVTRLVKAGLVAPTWSAGLSRGVVATGQVGFIVRKGNPKGIRSWDDLLKPGVTVLTPNPLSSGAAKWNLLAAYAAWSDGGRNRSVGLSKLAELLQHHVPVEDKSGREALSSFVSGTGDVLLTYDYEIATYDRMRHGTDQALELVRPDSTMRIDLVYALTRSAGSAARPFADYLVSKPAQEVFAAWGYRPVDAEVIAEHRTDFPTPATLWTIDDLGGWPAITADLFDPETGQVSKIQSGTR